MRLLSIAKSFESPKRNNSTFKWLSKFLKDLSMKRDLRAFSKLRLRRKNNHLSSTFKLQLHKAFKVSRKPCRNLCSFKWLKRRRNIVRHLTPSGSFTLNIYARSYKREKFVFENCSWFRVLFLAHSDKRIWKVRIFETISSAIGKSICFLRVL